MRMSRFACAAALTVAAAFAASQAQAVTISFEDDNPTSGSVSYGGAGGGLMGGSVSFSQISVDSTPTLGCTDCFITFDSGGLTSYGAGVGGSDFQSYDYNWSGNPSDPYANEIAGVGACDFFVFGEYTGSSGGPKQLACGQIIAADASLTNQDNPLDDDIVQTLTTLDLTYIDEDLQQALGISPAIGGAEWSGQGNTSGRVDSFDEATGAFEVNNGVADVDWHFTASAAVDDVPEPATLGLFGAALLGLGALGSRRRQRA